MKTKFFFIVIIAALQLLFINPSKAQFDFIPDQTTGKPLTTARYENVSGTPFLIDSWLSGEVKLSNGNLVKPKALKFDAVENKLLFQQDNKTFEFFPKVAAFKLFVPNGARTFLLKDDNKGEYFELLSDGKVKLFKKTKKTVLERKGYNSATVEKVIDENIKYYLVANGKETEVKLTKKSFINALPLYKQEISKYNLDSSDLETAYIALVNSLEKK